MAQCRLDVQWYNSCLTACVAVASEIRCVGTTTVVTKVRIEGVQLMSAVFTVMSVQSHVSVMSVLQRFSWMFCFVVWDVCSLFGYSCFT